MFEIAIPDVKSQEKISTACSNLAHAIKLHKETGEKMGELKRAIFYQKSRESAGLVENKSLVRRMVENNKTRKMKGGKKK